MWVFALDEPEDIIHSNGTKTCLVYLKDKTSIRMLTE